MAAETITIRGDTRDATRALQDLEETVESVGQELQGLPRNADRAGDAIEDAADKGSGGFSRLQAGIVTASSVLGGLAGGLSIFESGVNQIRGIFEDFFDSTEEGSEYTEALTRQFRELSTIFVEAFTGSSDPREVFEELSEVLSDVISVMRTLSRIASVALRPLIEIGTGIVGAFSEVAEAFERNARTLSDNERAVQRLTRRYEEAEQAALAQADAARLAAEEFVSSSELGRAAQQVDFYTDAWRGLVDQIDLASAAEEISGDVRNRLNQRLLSQSEALAALEDLFARAAREGQAYQETIAGINAVPLSGDVFEIAERAGASRVQLEQLGEVFDQLLIARGRLDDPGRLRGLQFAEDIEEADELSSSLGGATESALDFSAAISGIGDALSAGGVASGMQALRDAVREIGGGGEIEALSLSTEQLEAAFAQLAALPDDVISRLLDDDTLAGFAEMVEESTSLEEALLGAGWAADELAKKVMGVTEAVPSMKEAWQVIRDEGESLTGVTETLGASLGTAFGNAIAGSENLGEGLKKAGKKFVSDIAKTYGALFLAQGAGLAATGNPQGIALIAAGTALFGLAAALGSAGKKDSGSGGSAGPTPQTAPRETQEVYIVDTEGRRSRAVQARELDAALQNAERYGLDGARSYGG